MRKFMHFYLASLLILPFVILPSVSALSDNEVVIFQLQTGGLGSGAASQELVLLYNSGLEDINVSDWCLQYSSAGNGTEFSTVSCIDPGSEPTELWLEAGGLVSFASPQFIETNPNFLPDFVFSAGIAGTGGHIRLIDNQESEVDRLGWGTAIVPEGVAAEKHIPGDVLSRSLEAEVLDTDVNADDFVSKTVFNPISSGLYEQEVLTDMCVNIDGLQTILPEGFVSDENGNCWLDICPNIDGLQVDIPVGLYVPDDQTNCIEVPIELEDAVLFITELLPNAPSYDTGFEFIEIHNPNDDPINLSGYRLQLGPDYVKEFTIPGDELAPGEYMTFSDTESGIVLPNSTATVRLIAPAGDTVSETAAYNTPDDDVSWALVEGAWIYTNQITPGQKNEPYLEPSVEKVDGVTSALVPCPAGKFRNPATNRCKNIETAVSQLLPCDFDEFRNPETNRCKKISSATSTLAPCNEGQFRNPETNRCKSVSSASSSDLEPCDEGQERNPETNRCRKIQVLGANSDGSLPDVTDIQVESTEGQFEWPIVAGTLFGATGYIGYEWRNELRQRLARLRKR